MSSNKNLKWLDLLFILLGVAGTVRLVRAGANGSEDFAVYWKAARLWMDHLPFYAYTKENLGFVFKYPPWILPPFLPIGLANYDLARWIWSILEISCILYAVRWLIKNGVEKRTAIGSAFLYWWIWLAHFFSGQITLLLLAFALWISPSKSRLAPSKLALLGISFTSKIFTLFTLVPRWKEFLNKRTIIYSVGFLLISHAIVLLNYPVQPGENPILSLYQAWMKAAASGNEELGAEVVRGQGNHGFVAAILRWIDPLGTKTSLDTVVSFVLFAVLGTLWRRANSYLSEIEEWLGWMALGVIVLPLAWHHSFVLAFPFSAIVFDQAIKSKDKKLIIMAFCGIAFVGLLVPQSIGKDWVKPLELVGVKSWGVILSMITILKVKNKSIVHAT